MKRFLLSLAVSAITFTVLAQAPQKETVIVGKFKSSGSMSSSQTEAVRSSIISGLVSKGRLHIVDAETDAQLQEMSKNRNFEDAVNAGNVLDEASSSVFKSLGANYIVTGTGLTYSSKYETSTNKDGKTVYNYTVTLVFSLKGYNIAAGTAVASKQFEVKGRASTEADAYNNAIKNVALEMSAFVNDHFPFMTYVLQLEAARKGKLKELYIHCGSDMGVKRGDTFKVIKIKDIGGVKSVTEVGRLRAIAVEGGELTKCTVTKGNEEIEALFNESEPKKTLVISWEQALIVF